MNAQNSAGDSALTVGASNGAQRATLELLVAHGAWRGHQNKAGDSAVMAAVKRAGMRFRSSVKVFLDGVDQDMESCVSTVKALVALKCPVNAQDANGDTPLIVAASIGLVDLVVELLRSNARTDLRNRKGRIALDAAKAHGHDKVVSLLGG